jgi:hypothetical protein
MRFAAILRHPRIKPEDKSRRMTRVGNLKRWNSAGRPSRLALKRSHLRMRRDYVFQ